MTKRHTYCVALILLCGMIGCGKNVKFGGRVTYSDDGSPLTTGTVCFSSGSFLARGELNQDGYYNLGSLKLNDGIPKGEYQIYIVGAYPAPAPLMPDPAVRTSAEKPSVPLIDPKFTQGKTSGLTAKIDGTSKTFDFKVDRYNPKK